MQPNPTPRRSHPDWHEEIAESITHQMLDMDFPELNPNERALVQARYMAWIILSLQAYDAMLHCCLSTDPSWN